MVILSINMTAPLSNTSCCNHEDKDPLAVTSTYSIFFFGSHPADMSIISENASICHSIDKVFCHLS